MSVVDCLAKLVKVGKITPQAAREAEALWRRYKNEFSLDHPPAQADASAALQAAREMQASSIEQRREVAMQTIRQTAIEREQMAHPHGPVAGAMGVLARDVYRTGMRNVDSRISQVRQEIFSRLDVGFEAYASKLAGLKKDTIGAWKMVGELFGVDSGDAIAKATAHAWQDVVTYGVDRAKVAGKRFQEMENWRVPQFWDGRRVRKIGKGDLVRDVLNAVETGGLRVFDKEALDFVADPARLKVLVEKAADDIVTEAGSAPVFSKHMRTFHFQQGQAGFDAFKTLQERYGAGNDIFSVMTGHANGMAQDIGIIEMLGPHPASTVAMLEKNARAAEKRGEAPFRAARMVGQESSGAIRRTYAVQSGEANGVESYAWGSFLGATRSILVSATLGSSAIPAVIGDSVTMALAARANGIPPLQLLGDTVKAIFNGGKIDREAAAHLRVAGHAMSDAAIGAARYVDETGMPRLAKSVSDFVIRISGMPAWTEIAKKTYALDMLRMIGRQVDRDLAHVDAPFRAFLDRYKITAAEWDHLRARPLYEFEGARYFDSSNVGTDPIVGKLFEGVLEERAFAVLEPDSRVRGFTTQGMRGGTLSGEIWRGATMYQSFSMTMMNTWLHGLFVKDGMYGSPAANRILFFASHLMAGAAIVQARQLLQGRDPIDMTRHPKFWVQAMLQGGGAGFLGDLVGGATEAADRSWMAKLTGPIGGLVDDTLRFGNAVVTGRPGAVSQGIRLGKHITPGSNLWFSRLATDRLIFDTIQKLADPHYHESFNRRSQRAIKEYNQFDWWRQGEATPERAPALSGRP